jgi:RNA recognition motif-containing protein
VDINPSRADEAITRLSGSELKGRTITVNYAKKKEEKGEP